MSHICVHRNGGALGPWVTKVSTGSGRLSITPFHNPFVSTLLPGQGLPPPVKTFLSNKPQIFFFQIYILSNGNFQENCLVLFKPQQLSLNLTFPSLFSNPRNMIFHDKALFIFQGKCNTGEM